ncbi:MAG: glycosyltransferase family 4 protein [Candidatus Omnitrophica bacterium]|nr:glycosyltransferase family 4 protein [Candidatus Omnitrophota bacterium]
MKKIKVAHIITRMIIGGAQENTLYTVEGLMSMPDYEVTLISGPTYGPEGSLVDQIIAKNIKMIVVPTLRRNINPLYDSIAFFHLLAILRREGFDIVHTHSSKAGILGRLAARCAKIKTIIHTIHGLPFHPYESWARNTIYKHCERWVARFTDVIITVCNAMIKQAVDAHIAPEGKFKTVYSGLDIESFILSHDEEACALRKKWGIPDDGIVIGKVARLFHLKGHTYLLDAAKIIIDKSPKTYFVFVGGGILERSLKAKAQRLGIANHIIFTALIQPEEIPLYLQAFDIVVHVSLREGLPRVVPQAFLSDRPVVAYDIDGARDVIDDGVNGFLVAPQQIEALAKQLLLLVNLPSLRRQFSKNGKQKAVALFSKEKMVHDIDNVYKRCLS